MLLYPEVLNKVQEEIDFVVGSGRLPSAEDRPKLVYTEAAWKESLRWHIAIPLGASFQVQQRGADYTLFRRSTSRVGGRRRLGRNASTQGNHLYHSYWVCPPDLCSILCAHEVSLRRHMLHDPSVFDRPEEYDPQRWLGEGAERLPSPASIIFGFGTRYVHLSNPFDALAPRRTQKILSWEVHCRQDIVRYHVEPRISLQRCPLGGGRMSTAARVCGLQFSVGISLRPFVAVL